MTEQESESADRFQKFSKDDIDGEKEYEYGRCQYCGKGFNDHQKKGSHVAWCDERPEAKENESNQSEAEEENEPDETEAESEAEPETEVEGNTEPVRFVPHVAADDLLTENWTDIAALVTESTERDDVFADAVRQSLAELDSDERFRAARKANDYIEDDELFRELMTFFLTDK